MAEQHKRHPSSQPPALRGIEGTLDLNNPLCLGAEGSTTKAGFTEKVTRELSLRLSKSLLSTEGRERNSRPRAGQEQRSGGGKGLDALEAGRPGKDYQEGTCSSLQYALAL